MSVNQDIKMLYNFYEQSILYRYKLNYNFISRNISFIIIVLVCIIVLLDQIFTSSLPCSLILITKWNEVYRFTIIAENMTLVHDCRIFCNISGKAVLQKGTKKHGSFAKISSLCVFKLCLKHTYNVWEKTYNDEK